MKLTIAGSRRFPMLGINYPQDWYIKRTRRKMLTILNNYIKLKITQKITAVVSGKSWGMDELGEIWAEKNGIPVIPCPAKWHELGKAAGPIRNAEMAAIGDELICISTRDSVGSKDMVKKMRALKKPTYHKIVREKKCKSTTT